MSAPFVVLDIILFLEGSWICTVDIEYIPEKTFGKEWRLA